MRIAQYLRKHKMTQKAFADRLGVSPALVSHWVNGTTAITAEHALQIERKTGGEVSRDICFEKAA